MSRCRALDLEVSVVADVRYREQMLFQASRRRAEQCFAEQLTVLGLRGTAVLRCPELERLNQFFLEIPHD